MTRLLDRMLGLTATKATASAGCPPETWVDCESHTNSAGVTRATWRTGHLTPQCTVYYTYVYNNIPCPG